MSDFTAEDIFMAGFADGMEKTAGEEVEMPVFAKIAANIGLLDEEEDVEEVEMPVFAKIAGNLGLLDEEEAEEEEVEITQEEYDNLSELEKIALFGLKRAPKKVSLKDKASALVGKLKERAGKAGAAAKEGLKTRKGRALAAGGGVAALGLGAGAKKVLGRGAKEDKKKKKKKK